MPPGEPPTNQPPTACMETQETRGRIIDPVPIISLLLEPRSVIITTGDLYTSHLHSIANSTTDHFATFSPQESTEVYGSSSRSSEEDEVPRRIVIDNLEQLGDERLKGVVRSGGELERKMRVSLTCRDVEKVSGLKVGLVGGRRK
jgi:alkylated DNA repair protein alkB family protein 6